MSKRRLKKHDPECACCNGGPDAEANMHAWEDEMMAKHGWYAHFVTDEDDQSPTGYNAHTHGLEAKGHLNFQVVMPVRPEVAHGVMGTLARRVMDGERFEAGQEVSEVIQPGYTIKLMLARECDRDVLRVIFPDADKRFCESAAAPFNEQHKGCLGVG